MSELLTNLKLRLKTLLRRKQLERDLEDEIAFHLSMREEKLSRSGVADPRGGAYRKFGNRTRIAEDIRDVWSFTSVESFYADLRIAMRLIRKNRWAMLAVVLSLSLGIGSVAAVFNLFDFFVVRSFPVPQTDRVVRIMANSQSSAIQYLVSNRDFEDIRDRAQNFEGIVSVSPDQLPFVITQPGQRGRNMVASLVSGNYFSTLHIQPEIGRGFLAEEDRAAGRDAVAVISYELWTREYGSRSDTIGRTIRINSKDFTIVGVAPERFYGLDPFARPAVYLPRVMEPVFANAAALTDRTSRRLQIVARLKDGLTLEEARAEIVRIGSQLEQENPTADRGQQLTVDTQFGAKLAVSPQAFIVAGVFFLVAALVLGIAGVNVANLLLSTAPSRTREMAIRIAMGAGRARLVRQMLLESVLVSVGGALVGLVLASICARFISSVEIFSNLPLRINVAVDLRVVLFALATAVAAGTCAALIPALRCSRGNLNALLKSEDLHIATPGKMRVRQGLVVVQVAVAVLVLVLSGVSLEELRLLRQADPGFKVGNVLRVALSSNPQNLAFFRRSLERVRGLPGVRAAAAAYPEPLGIGTEATNVIVDGFALPLDQASLAITSSSVSDGYFETLGIPILRGRSFNARDTEENARVVIVNEVMAAKYWPNGDALGKHIRTIGFSLVDSSGVTLEVIGVARTSKYRSLSEAPTPFLYLPMKEKWPAFGTFLIATEGEPAALAMTVTKTLTDVDPNAPIYDSGTMSQYLNHQALLTERLMAEVLAGVAVIGLILSVLGLYGVVSYSVSQRTHEIGIRIAIGATTGNVFRLILRQGLKLSAIGITAGIITSVLMRSLLDVFFFLTNTTSSSSTTAVYAIVITASLAVTTLASYLPARRASLVDPNVALRSDN
jgi:predicted permease